MFMGVILREWEEDEMKVEERLMNRKLNRGKRDDP